MAKLPNRIEPTHTGVDSDGRRVPLRYDPTSGRYLTRSEYRAIYAGATREWGTYTDILPIDVIRDIFALARHVGAPIREGDAKGTAASVSRRLFKDTECGISVFWSPPLNESYGYIVVAGYAEGTDAECPPYELRFPFSAADFDAAVAKADADGCALFNEVHNDSEEG